MMKIGTQLEKTYFKSLDRMFGSNYFVCTCSSLKGLTQQLKISKFYKDALFDWIDFRKTLQTHTTFLNPDTSLFGNSLITFRRKNLFFKSFLKSDITKLKDIWDFQGNCFVEDRLLYTTLVDKRKWIMEWTTLKNMHIRLYKTKCKHM